MGKIVHARSWWRTAARGAISGYTACGLVIGARIAIGRCDEITCAGCIAARADVAQLRRK